VRTAAFQYENMHVCYAILSVTVRCRSRGVPVSRIKIIGISDADYAIGLHSCGYAYAYRITASNDQTGFMPQMALFSSFRFKVIWTGPITTSYLFQV